MGLTVKINTEEIEPVNEQSEGWYIARHEGSEKHNRILCVRSAYNDKDRVIVFMENEDIVQSYDLATALRIYKDWKAVEVTIEVD